MACSWISIARWILICDVYGSAGNGSGEASGVIEGIEVSGSAAVGVEGGSGIVLVTADESSSKPVSAGVVTSSDPGIDEGADSGLGIMGERSGTVVSGGC
ncbi:MAG: hypothetical protein PHV98_06085 [Candidatus Omnitrophica bacterium]|nr:hypothetical protein [Candidatus Omnitrophota bacterium]